MTTLIDIIAQNIELRETSSAILDDAATQAGGVTKTAMTAIASAFVGYNGSDDDMKATIKEGWWRIAQARNWTDSKGVAYASADKIPTATMADYLTFTRAGHARTFDAASAAAAAFGGKWYQNTRDLLRRNAKDGTPLTVEGLTLIHQQRDAKRAERNNAIEAMVKGLRRLSKAHGDVVTADCIKLLEAQKSVVAHVAAPVVKAAAPAPVVAPVVAPVAQPTPVVSGPPLDIAQLLAQVGNMMDAKLAAFVSTKKSAKK
jgi:hypothetical protein